MDTLQLLEEITARAKAGTLSRSDVLAALDRGAQAASGGEEHRSLSVADVLAFLGGLIVVIGIVVLVSTNWDSFGSVLRILTTLGFACGVYVAGVLLQQQGSSRLQLLADVFFCIAMVLLPLGLGVTFHEMGLPWDNSPEQVFLSLLAFAGALGAFFTLKRKLFVVFSVAYGTWLFFALLHFIHPESSVTGRLYVCLFTGIAYMFLASAFAKTTLRPLSGLMNFVGSATFLGCALALGEWEPSTAMPILWQLLFPILIIGMIFVSVRLRSTAILITSAISIVAYIIKMTAEYFSDSIGWPFAIVLAGFLLIGVGFGMMRIKRKYIV